MFRIKGYFNQKSTDGKFSDQKWSLKKIQNKKGSKNDFFPHEKKNQISNNCTEKLRPSAVLTFGGRSRSRRCKTFGYGRRNSAFGRPLISKMEKL